MELRTEDLRLIDILVLVKLQGNPSTIQDLTAILKIDTASVTASLEFLVYYDFASVIFMDRPGEPDQCRQVYSADPDILEFYRESQKNMELNLNETNLPDIALDLYSEVGRCPGSSEEIATKLGITVWDARIFLDYFTRKNKFWKFKYGSYFQYALAGRERFKFEGESDERDRK